VTPSPFIPLPLDKGKGEGFRREAPPLFDSPLVSLSLKGEGLRPSKTPYKYTWRLALSLTLFLCVSLFERREG